MGNELVSVMIPVYNAGNCLDECIESILKQTYENFELILIDDGSTDGSGECCDKWAALDDRIIVHHQKNGGVSVARNKGVELARGDYLVYVDADDIVTEEYIQYLYNLIQDFPDCKWAACNHLIERKGRTIKNSEIEGVHFYNIKDSFLKVLYHDTIDVSPCCKIYRKGLLNKDTYPVGKIYEDAYAFGEILLEAGGMVYGANPCYTYNQQEESIVNGAYKERRDNFTIAADHLAELAIAYDDTDEMRKAAMRRRVHARLSLLRYMQNSPKEMNEAVFLQKRDEYRDFVLKNGSEVLSDERAPKRDKIAIRAIKLGYGCYFKLWDIYSKVR